MNVWVVCDVKNLRCSVRTIMRCVRLFALESRNDELIVSSGVENDPAAPLADHLAGQPEVEVAMSQPRLNFGDDPAERAIASATR